MHQYQSLLKKEIIPNSFKGFQEQVCLLIFSRKSELAEETCPGVVFYFTWFDWFLTYLEVTVLSL